MPILYKYTSSMYMASATSDYSQFGTSHFQYTRRNKGHFLTMTCFSSHLLSGRQNPLQLFKRAIQKAVSDH